MGIFEEESITIWKHNGYTAAIFTLRLSPDQKYLLSGGWDFRLVLVSSFSDLKALIVGLLWLPGNGSSSTIVCLSKEIALIEIDFEKEANIHKKSQFIFGHLEPQKATGMNAFWEK